MGFCSSRAFWVVGLGRLGGQDMGEFNRRMGRRERQRNPKLKDLKEIEMRGLKILFLLLFIALSYL